MKNRQATVEWDALDGRKFRFEFDLEKHHEASSVMIAGGAIFPVISPNHENRKVASFPAHKKRKTEEPEAAQNPNSYVASDSEEGPECVGYLNGCIIQRNNPGFHRDGDIVSQELHEFTVSLYDHRGSKCRVPKNKSKLGEIPASAGGMLLIEMVEIQNDLKGIDLGINFVHEFLKFCKKDVGVCVMNPTTLSENALRYEDNREQMKKDVEDKSKSEQVDIMRNDTVKVRRQFSRMGFRAVQNTPEYLDYWFLPMDTYKSAAKKETVKNSWLSKEAAGRLKIAMQEKKHIETEHDKKMKELLGRIFDRSNAGMDPSSAMMGMQMGMMPLRLNTSTGVTNEDKRQIQQLVQAGASLQGINALHMAAANYKSGDLFDYLITECHMHLDTFDHSGNLPIHVAVGCSNTAAVRILLDRGANKKAKNKDGLTPGRLLDKQMESMQDFSRVFGIGLGGMGIPGLGGNDELKQMLR